MQPAANDPAEARKLYLRLVKRHHPDLAAPEDRDLATQLTQQINAAWDARDIIKLRDIEAHGAGFFAWEAERRRWAEQAAALARARAMQAAMHRREEAAAQASPQPMDTSWGPRPGFSHVDVSSGVFAAIFAFVNPWSPCANWAVSGEDFLKLRYLVQFAILAAWAGAGVGLFLIGASLRHAEGIVRWTASWLVQAVGLAIVGTIVIRISRQSAGAAITFVIAILCGELVSRTLGDVPGFVAYGLVIGCGAWIASRRL